LGKREKKVIQMSLDPGNQKEMVMCVSKKNSVKRRPGNVPVVSYQKAGVGMRRKRIARKKKKGG